jgi:hypothetical protein
MTEPTIDEAIERVRWFAGREGGTISINAEDVAAFRTILAELDRLRAREAAFSEADGWRARAQTAEASIERLARERDYCATCAPTANAQKPNHNE